MIKKYEGLGINTGPGGKMKWIGLTGGIASGKSSVSSLLVEQQIPVIDADKMAHQALEPQASTYSKIVNHFGPTIQDKDGMIDRGALGGLVFNSPSELVHLEAIIHPYVQEMVKKNRDALQDQGHRLAVYDVPLLFEKQMETQFDHVVVVYCSEAQQLERLKKRNSFTNDEARLRIKNQMSIEVKKQRASSVIDNSGSESELAVEVDRWLKANAYMK